MAFIKKNKGVILLYLIISIGTLIIINDVRKEKKINVEIKAVDYCERGE